MFKLLRCALVLMILVTGTRTFAQGDTDCLTILSNAEAEFAGGRFYGIPSMLDDCLSRNRFSNEEQVRVYMLLTQVYLLTDQPEAADNAYLKLLNANPEFVPSDSDPIDVIYLSKKFTSTPIFTPHIKVGGNLSRQALIYTQNAVSTPDSTRVRHSPMVGWTFGGGLEWNVGDNWGVGVEGFLSQKRFRTTTTHLFGADDSQVEERQLWIDVPVYLRYQWHKGRIRPFGYVGGAVNFLIGAKVEESYNDRTEGTGDEGTQVTPVNAPARGILYKRNFFNRSVVVGGGAKFKIGKDFIVADVRFMPGLTNVVNRPYANYASKDRDALDPSMTRFASMSDIFRVNNFSLMIGYVRPLYNPRKATRVKTKSVSKKLLKANEDE